MAGGVVIPRQPRSTRRHAEEHLDSSSVRSLLGGSSDAGSRCGSREPSVCGSRSPSRRSDAGHYDISPVPFSRRRHGQDSSPMRTCLQDCQSSTSASSCGLRPEERRRVNYYSGPTPAHCTPQARTLTSEMVSMGLTRRGGRRIRDSETMREMLTPDLPEAISNRNRSPTPDLSSRVEAGHPPRRGGRCTRDSSDGTKAALAFYGQAARPAVEDPNHDLQHSGLYRKAGRKFQDSTPVASLLKYDGQIDHDAAPSQGDMAPETTGRRRNALSDFNLQLSDPWARGLCENPQKQRSGVALRCADDRMRIAEQLYDAAGKPSELPDARASNEDTNENDRNAGTAASDFRMWPRKAPGSARSSNEGRSFSIDGSKAPTPRYAGASPRRSDAAGSSPLRGRNPEMAAAQRSSQVIPKSLSPRPVLSRPVSPREVPLSVASARALSSQRSSLGGGLAFAGSSDAGTDKISAREYKASDKTEHPRSSQRQSWSWSAPAPEPGDETSSRHIVTCEGNGGYVMAPRKRLYGTQPMSVEHAVHPYPQRRPTKDATAPSELWMRWNSPDGGRRPSTPLRGDESERSSSMQDRPASRPPAGRSTTPGRTQASVLANWYSASSVCLEKQAPDPAARPPRSLTPQPRERMAHATG
eukprot:TRINITY_DN31251_c0_g1_i1.p1 TRINITY_DN31251_c0_g1~~TRINITY_DN31251_c0_g1_i1.p1  ORF type:complete len:678 (-),score=59.69 TRINITY_DN31251_c0_g1_i1:169-2094(-)